MPFEYSNDFLFFTSDAEVRMGVVAGAEDGIGAVDDLLLLAVGGYLALWGLSYPVIYAGACRYCAYYGKACPIPLEGSCVHYFFKKSFGPFFFLIM